MTEEEKKKRQREYNRRYRKNHPEAVLKNRERAKEYYHEHRDEVLAYNRAYAKAHSLALSDYRRTYYQKHKEKICEYQKERYWRMKREKENGTEI